MSSRISAFSLEDPSMPNNFSSAFSKFRWTASATDFCFSGSPERPIRGDGTFVIVGLPSGRRFGTNEGTWPPGIRNAERADASVSRETWDVEEKFFRFSERVERELDRSVTIVLESSVINIKEIFTLNYV